MCIYRNSKKMMQYTLIAILVLGLALTIDGKPAAVREKSIRKTRQANFDRLFGGSSHFGHPYAGGRLNLRGDFWDASFYGLRDLRGNDELGGGLGFRRNGWRWGADGTLRSDSSWKAGSRLSYDRHDFGGYLSGNIDSSGDYSVGVGFRYRPQKRSAASVNERFNVTLRADPCNFYAYDFNRDGVITAFEFKTIFGSDENTRNLFNALDVETGDGVLMREEFEAMSAKVIADCETSSEK